MSPPIPLALLLSPPIPPRLPSLLAPTIRILPITLLPLPAPSNLPLRLISLHSTQFRSPMAPSCSNGAPAKNLVILVFTSTANKPQLATASLLRLLPGPLSSCADLNRNTLPSTIAGLITNLLQGLSIGSKMSTSMAPTPCMVPPCWKLPHPHPPLLMQFRETLHLCCESCAPKTPGSRPRSGPSFPVRYS